MNGDEAEYGLGTIYGTEHPWFWRIHITALISLGQFEAPSILDNIQVN